MITNADALRDLKQFVATLLQEGFFVPKPTFCGASSGFRAFDACNRDRSVDDGCSNRLSEELLPHQRALKSKTAGLFQETDGFSGQDTLGIETTRSVPSASHEPNS